MEEPAEKSAGILASGKRLVATLLSIARNRLELLAVELQEERARLFEALLLVAGVVVFATLTLAMLSLAVIAALWREHRVAALAGLGFFYLAAALLTYWRLQHRLKNWTVLSGTMAELEKDKACLDDLR